MLSAEENDLLCRLEGDLAGVVRPQELAASEFAASSTSQATV